MAYYLMVEEKKEQYSIIDINRSPIFYRTSKFKGNKASLEEIDNFTVMFYDETELRRHLLDNKLISESNYGRNLSIRLARGGKYHKVMYDFLYQKDIEYIMDPKKLIKRVKDKLIEKDYIFIIKYANKYIKYHGCEIISAEVREFANYSLKTGVSSRHFYEYDENGDDPLTIMTKLLIYEHKYDYGKIVYSDNTKYRNLHDIIAFINNYEKKNKKEIEQVEEDQLSLFQVAPKDGKKRKKVIDGQFILKDFLN